MQIFAPALEVIQRLHAAGRQAYLVGGCVRDVLMGREPKDWDVATDAGPASLLALFENAEPIGAHFGVILWRGVEIATFRSDGPYGDGRHPDSVVFETDPARDAGRRDFTINGLFFDVLADRVVDFVGGEADISRGLIRAIGQPEERFAEDHLRLLRAVRFAANFGFSIEPETAAAIRSQAGSIAKVAAERVRDEMTKVLTGGGPRRGFELLDELELLSHVLPEVKALQGVEQPPEFHPEGDVWTHTLLMLDGMRSPSVTLALGVLMHDIAKPATFERLDRIRFNGHAELGAKMSVAILGRLRYPGAVIEQVRELVAQHLKFIAVRQMKESTRRRFLRQEILPELLELHRLDCLASHRQLGAYEFCLEELDRLPPEALRPARLLNGAELMALGVPEGPAVGRVLRSIEDAQLEGAIATREEAMAWALQSAGL